jgi:Family of unknown function (DUF5995)
VSTVEEAIARMQAIDAALPPADGLACFNRMYLDVTQKVLANIQQAVFADPTFMTQLDVTFANLYLDAVNALTLDAHNIPVAWRPLMHQRLRSDIEPIQFALAGMNAHINHDLPLAVVKTCSILGTTPDDGTHHDDYQKVDALLDAAEQSVRQDFETSAELEVDKHAQACANVIANWTMNSARDVAWDTALALWEIRNMVLANELFLSMLARSVAMASRCLLVVV